MPKIIELTVELEVKRVSCPGVWLCQDGKVILTVYALGTSYQTCLLPPTFPLTFKDVFYFRKRFKANCALSNICCVLKDEIIYCELLQKLDCCSMTSTIILAQYLGQLNDMLFPPNVCSNDGVDLLMRRTKEFPGILSPKIEVATKVRIDEVSCSPTTTSYQLRVETPCGCKYSDPSRQRKVCHSPEFHRTKCCTDKASSSVMRSKSLERTLSPGQSRSHNALYHDRDKNLNTKLKSHNELYHDRDKNLNTKLNCISRSPRRVSPSLRTTSLSPGPPPPPRQRSLSPPASFRSKCSECKINNGDFYNNDKTWIRVPRHDVGAEIDERLKYKEAEDDLAQEENLHRSILESRFIDREQRSQCVNYADKYTFNFRTEPCVCEICKKYHDTFHTGVYET